VRAAWDLQVAADLLFNGPVAFTAAGSETSATGAVAGADTGAASGSCLSGATGDAAASGQPPLVLQPVGHPLCGMGCIRMALGNWPGCCRRCCGPSGPHTRSCQDRLRGPIARQAVPRPSVPAQPVQPADPPPVTVAHAGFECPVCLERQTEQALVGDCRRHPVCEQCREQMIRAGLLACPLCRQTSPPTSVSVGSTQPAPQEDRSSMPGYVVLRTPVHLDHLAGFHPVTWGQLEMRLAVPAG